MCVLSLSRVRTQTFKKALLTTSCNSQIYEIQARNLMGTEYSYLTLKNVTCLAMIIVGLVTEKNKINNNNLLLITLYSFHR